MVQEKNPIYVVTSHRGVDVALPYQTCWRKLISTIFTFNQYQLGTQQSAIHWYVPTMWWSAQEKKDVRQYHSHCIPSSHGRAVHKSTQKVMQRRGGFGPSSRSFSKKAPTTLLCRPKPSSSLLAEVVWWSPSESRARHRQLSIINFPRFGGRTCLMLLSESLLQTTILQAILEKAKLEFTNTCLKQ